MATRISGRTTPTLWLVRAERKGQDEVFNFREGMTSIHWNDSPDPRNHSRQELEAFFEAHPPSGGIHAAEQIDRFCHEMQIGHYIVTPRWNYGHMYEQVAVGVVTGEYDYLDHDPEPTPRQTRTVDWLTTDLDREALNPQTQSHLSKQRFTCSVVRKQAVVRDILAHIEGLERSPHTIIPTER